MLRGTTVASLRVGPELVRVLVLVPVLVLVGCAEPPRVPQRAYEVSDLASRGIQVGRLDAEGNLTDARHGTWQPVGSPRFEVGTGGDGDRATPALVRTLEHLPSERLLARISLGATPFFSFRMLSESCTYRLEVRSPGSRDLIWEALHDPSGRATAGWSTADESVVDLSSHAGATAELRLGATCSDPDTRVRWGSPIAASRRAAEARPSTGRPNILLIGADTLRADALGAYGRQPTLTPALDRLASESEVWTSAFATANVTVPSFASILTGLYPLRHGLFNNRQRASPEWLTLGGILRGEGYASAAFLGARHVDRAKLGRDFDLAMSARTHSAGEVQVNAAMAWISKQEGPWLAWVHLYDPHTPHTPPAPFAEGLRPARPFGLEPVTEWVPFRQTGPREFDDPQLGGHRELYDGEVAYLDRQVDRLVGFLTPERLARTIVLFVADHGENLGDHGILYRHSGLWESVVQVPMMIRWPDGQGAGLRRDHLVQTLDLLPTLLDHLDLPAPDIDGIPLAALGRAGGREWVYAEHDNRAGAMVRNRRFKYFESHFDYAIPKGRYLYRLDSDPDEVANIVDGSPIGDELQAALARWLGSGGSAPAIVESEASEEELRALRALGYVD